MKPVWTSLFNTQSGPGTQFPDFALLLSAFLFHRTYFLLTEHKISLLISFLVHGLLSLFTRLHSPGRKCHRAGHLYVVWKVEYSIILLHFLHNSPNKWFALYFKFRWCDHCLNNPLTKRNYFLLFRPVLLNEVAISHIWLFKLRVNKIQSSVPQQPYFWSSAVTCS